MPASYIDELAARAEQISADEWRQTEEIRCQLAEKPASLSDLRRELEERPGLQAQLAWKTGYTPSKWLLENEMDAVRKRRDKVGVKVPVEAADDVYEAAARS